MEFLPSITYQKNARYYPYHWRKGRKLEQCITFRRTFDEKRKAREILFQEKSISINDRPFPTMVNKCKGQVMITSSKEMEIEKDDQQTSESEPDLDRMAQHVQNLFTFMKFYN